MRFQPQHCNIGGSSGKRQPVDDNRQAPVQRYALQVDADIIGKGFDALGKRLPEGFAVSRINVVGRLECLCVHSLNQIKHHASIPVFDKPLQFIKMFPPPVGDGIREKRHLFPGGQCAVFFRVKLSPAGYFDKNLFSMRSASGPVSSRPIFGTSASTSASVTSAM